MNRIHTPLGPHVLYIGVNQYRVRFFDSPLGFTKVLIDTFIRPNFINLTEFDLPLCSSADLVENFARMRIAEIESYT